MLCTCRFRAHGLNGSGKVEYTCSVENVVEEPLLNVTLGSSFVPFLYPVYNVLVIIMYD